LVAGPPGHQLELVLRNGLVAGPPGHQLELTPRSGLMAGLPSRTDSDGPGDEQPLPSGPKPPRANGAAIPLVTIATSQAVTSREARVAAGNANTATISVPTAMITLASATDYNSPQLRAVCLLRRVA
jgi:hypothetical protein